MPDANAPLAQKEATVDVVSLLAARASSLADQTGIFFAGRWPYVFRRRLVMDVLEQGFPFAEMIADRLTAGHPGRPHFRQQRGTLDAPLTFIMRGDATFGARR